ncbi:MAG: hypothetical protein RIQ85_1451 [Pseudomonadota bacterium]|jgi:hypothetical protein
MHNFDAASQNNVTISLVLGQWVTKIFTPQRTTQEQTNKRVSNARQLINLAKDVEQSQPNLAAEFRNFASRS